MFCSDEISFDVENINRFIMGVISGIQVINLPQQGGGQPIAMVSILCFCLYWLCFITNSKFHRFMIFMG